MDTSVSSRKTNNLAGVVICGGMSTRMGSDKAFTNYHSLPQYQYIHNLLSQYCDQVFVSCNKVQLNKFPENVSLIVDEEKFQDAGPMTGLLSVISFSSNNSILLIGCDYPFLDEGAIEKLINARDSKCDAVCYFNDESGMYEPLIGIYETSCFVKLNAFYLEGNTSLQQFLKTISAMKVTAGNPQTIQSIDTKEQYQEVILYLSKRSQ